MKATSKQWETIKTTVKSVFGKDFRCREEFGEYVISGRDGMNIIQAEALYVVLKKIGYTWSEFEKDRTNPIYSKSEIFTASFDIVK